jgi:hypothetical protein
MTLARVLLAVRLETLAWADLAIGYFSRIIAFVKQYRILPEQRSNNAGAHNTDRADSQLQGKQLKQSLCEEKHRWQTSAQDLTRPVQPREC